MDLKIFATILMMGLGSAVHAKCPFMPYRVTGEVFDETSKRPVSQATVMVFLDNQSRIWADGGYARKHPDFVITNNQGVFVAPGAFLTYNGDDSQGDRCTKMPERLEVIVLAPGHLTHREIVKFDAVKQKRRNDTMEVTLKPIYVSKPRHER
jgi:hypothetical protein